MASGHLERSGRASQSLTVERATDNSAAISLKLAPAARRASARSASSARRAAPDFLGRVPPYSGHLFGRQKRVATSFEIETLLYSYRFPTMETQAVQPRFEIGKHSPRAPCLGALAIADHLLAPSADEPSDVIGSAS